MDSKTILKKILEKEELTQKEFAEKIGYSPSYISKIASGKSALGKDFKQTLETFGYNIRSLSDNADEPKDEAVAYYEYFEEIFEEITATPKNRDKDKKFLRLRMNKHLYDFFLNIDSAKERQEQGSLCFEEEFDKFRKIYLENEKDYQDYILIPCDDMPELVENETRKRRCLQEVLALSDDITDYLDVPKSEE